MPRNVWAKVWCDFLRHPRFRRRPDCDVRLALGLILYAKEYAALDGIVRDLDAETMRSMFGISAPLQKVQDGLEYLLRCGWLEHADEDGSLRIKDFVRRQAADSKAMRMMRWRDGRSERGVDASVDAPVDDRVDASETRARRKARPASTFTSPEEEEEEEERDLDPGRSSKNGESEGKDSTACEFGDNPAVDCRNLSESERSHVLKLFRDGKGAEASAFLATIQKKGIGGSR